MPQLKKRSGAFLKSAVHSMRMLGGSFRRLKARESAITHKTEHMWIEDARFEEEKIVGTLSREPNAIPEVSKGDWISIPIEKVSDWAYRQGGRTIGGFTVRVMQRRGLEP